MNPDWPQQLTLNAENSQSEGNEAAIDPMESRSRLNFINILEKKLKCLLQLTKPVYRNF